MGTPWDLFNRDPLPFQPFPLLPRKSSMQLSHQFYFFKVCRNSECKKRVRATNSIPPNPTSFDFQCFISTVLCEEFQLLFAQPPPPLSLLGLGVKQQHLRGSKVPKKRFFWGSLNPWILSQGTDMMNSVRRSHRRFFVPA